IHRESDAPQLSAATHVIDVAADREAPVAVCTDEAGKDVLGTLVAPLREGWRRHLGIGIIILLVGPDRYQLGCRTEIGRDQLRGLPRDRRRSAGATIAAIRRGQRRNRDDDSGRLL